nr:DNA primase [uncultured Ruminococcus sp.]
MARLSDDFIREIKYRNDLGELAGAYMQLKRGGRDLVGLCPFHGEKTPSFHIRTENGLFHCFGCGAGGDVITFVMKIENLDYMEAVKFLAQRAGMSMPEDDYDDSLSKMRTRIYEANREAARFYYQKLISKEGAQGLSYLRNRGLADRTIRHFGLGFAPDERFALGDHLRSRGFTENEMIAANLVFKSRSGNSVLDRFYNRVMFPIIDVRGNVIAFGGRIMSDQKPKYLNTSDTLVFNKSNNLFSLNNAKNSKSDSLILCEGYMDVISLNQAGFTNAVATLGTALTPDQAALMKRYCKEVLICYDADEAGQKATARAIDILRKAGLIVRVITIPDGKDPDEFIRRHGDQGHAAFQNIINGSGNDMDYRMSKLKARYDMNATQDKLNYLNEAVNLLCELDNPMEREIYASKLSDETGVSVSSIKEQVDNGLKRRRRAYRKNEFSQAQRSLSARDDRVNPQHASNLRATNAEESLIAYLINHPDRLTYIHERVKPEDFTTDFSRKLYEYFSERILNNLDPLTALSRDFTSEEQSKIVEIADKYKNMPHTREALDEFIGVILDESSKPTEQDIRNSSAEEFTDLFSNLKSKKTKPNDQ